MTDSILDKVIDSQKNAATANFNPQEILKSLLDNLKEREVEVLSLRYGLKDNIKKTLEEIGGKFTVTRERIRQIENAALKKIKNLEKLDELIKSLEIVIYQTLEAHGGVMKEDSLIKKSLASTGNTPANYAAAQFILSKFLGNKLHYLEGDDELHSAWKLPTVSLDSIKSILQLIIEAIKRSNTPLSAVEIAELTRLEELPEEWQNKLDDYLIQTLLEISKVVATNPFNEWGMAGWEAIALKRMSDKIYLVLKKEGQPLHFKEIAAKINKIGFDSKIANPATIHNELILDDKYVLVGRGIYALSEWGYKPGVVAEVVAEVLREAGAPLSRDEIIAKVSAKRLVKKSTIVLSLMNKARFKKLPGNKYTLV
ncbi:MAG: hypothetical protein NTZ18_02065 [Candidatus Komeilibacteria bacterium]|nr:hypothetical protein [Candidatus Komeilibacteria bacterium]